MPLTSKLVVARCGDHLRNMSDGVQSLEFVALGGKRIKELSLVEALSYFEVVILARDRVKVGQHFAHASEFSAEDVLHVAVTQGLGIAVDRCSHFFSDIEGLYP